MKTTSVQQQLVSPLYEVARAFVAASNAGCAVFGADNRFLDCNKKLLSLLGHSEATGLCALIGLRPADRASSAYIQFERLRAGKVDTFSGDYQLMRKDGSLFWADVSIKKVSFHHFDDERLTIVNIINIEKERSAHIEIEQNQTRFEAALDAAGHGMWEFDRTTDKLVLSAGWKKLRGIPASEDVKMDRISWLARVHPDDVARVDQTSDQQGQGDDGYDIVEYRERHRDGHYIWIYSRGRPYEFDKDGKPLRVIGTDTDISKLKAIEAELAAEKERLHVTLESIADGVISCDAQGRLTFLNEAAEKMTGWRLEEAINLPLSKVFNSVEDSAKSRKLNFAGQCMRENAVQRQEGYSKLHNRDGTELFVRQTAAPLHNIDGQTVGAVVVFRDATQRRKLQQELEYAATHDQLTGLANRNALESQLDAAIKSSGDGNNHALLLMDLDHFKAVNDKAGHAAGDALLNQIGQLIKSCCRDGDCVARIGGDEFVVVLTHRSMRTARTIAQRIVDKVSNLEFRWQKETFQVGISIGVASITDPNAERADIMKLADNACYGAKRNGRNCLVVGG